MLPTLFGLFFQSPEHDLVERLLFIEALEALSCLDEGVIGSADDANLGSLLAIGYPEWTGGVLAYIERYRGGPQGFLARANGLAETYGERFRPPSIAGAPFTSQPNWRR